MDACSHVHQHSCCIAQCLVRKLLYLPTLHTEHQFSSQHAAGRYAKLQQQAFCCRTNVHAAVPVKGVRAKVALFLPRCRYGQDWRRQAPPFLQDCGCSVCEPCPVYLPWLQLLPEVKHLRTTSGKLLPVSEKKRTGNTTPFSVNLTRSQVSHQAAQCLCLLCLTGSAYLFVSML